MSVHEQVLRELALHDERRVEHVLSASLAGIPEAQLPPRTEALVRLGALVAMDAATASYQWGVDAALAAGATPDEIVGVLIALAPAVGVAGVVSAAPEIALALGVDVDAAVEEILRHGAA